MSSMSRGNKVRKRCEWLSANVFRNYPIDEGAIAALCTLPYPRAMEMCADLEAKADSVKNPSAYLTQAVNREGGAGGGGGGGYLNHFESEGAIAKRCRWLNTNIFWADAILEPTMAKMSSLGLRRAMELLRDLEENAKNVGNPDGFLLNAVRREGGGQYHQSQHYGGYDRSWGGRSQDGHTRLHRQSTWLNANVFWPGAIDEEAIGQLSTIDLGRAMTMLKEVEGKADVVENPSGYLKNAVRRENLYDWSSSRDGWWEESWDDSSWKPQEANTAIHRRATWINENVYWSGAIDRDAILQLSGIDFGRAMDMLRDVEEKAESVDNPSGFLKAAVRRETYTGSSEEIDERVQKRCTWLNMNVYSKGAIDKDAIAKLSTLTFRRAMAICKDLEEKGKDQITNPSGYAKAAVLREPLENVQDWAGGYAPSSS
eukprot:TRINITY_DN28774_c0_g1_i1.p1 TRINITY_DN28774_c0_g1~~TRINITY_DN28774_c0_g1_i1.p1  ORF type:complete len:428 (+),score=81.55 TRINITY_DN28774_c0_g1_i1:93-1376(+)